MTTQAFPVSRWRPGRALLWLLAALLFGLGFVAGLLVRGTVWTVAAVKVGFRDGRGAR